MAAGAHTLGLIGTAFGALVMFLHLHYVQTERFD